MNITPTVRDWELGPLGNIAEVLMGQSPPGYSYNTGRLGAPLINGPTEFTTTHPIAKQWTTAPIRLCRADDTLICVRGSSTGRINVADANYCIGRGVAAVRARRRNDQQFVRFALSAVVDQLLTLQTGSTFPSIDARAIRNGVIFIPSPEEQREIAEILTDIDDTVADLELLITKQEAIKHGIMQQLVIGNTRLQGFDAPWRMETVGDVATIVSGGTPDSSIAAYWNGDIAWCTPTDITCEPSRYLHKTQRTLTSFGLENSSASLLPTGSLLLCSRATIGELKIALTPIATNQGFKALIPKPGVSGAFIYYAMLLAKGRLAGLGSGSTFLEVSKRDVAGLPLNMPRYDEQTAIAETLGDADDEIDQLRMLRTKLEAVKQGMMQALLTGHTRLPSLEAEAR